ncbi:MAG TPA: hypothetical protein VIT22_01820 [Pseudoxanthomonas sp.]
MPKAQRVRQVAIPTPYEDAGALYRTAVATKELVEMLAGQRGDRDDHAVTWADMPKPGPTLPAATPPALETWNPIPYVNGWVDYSAPYSPCGFRKLSSGLVIMRGLCMSGTAATICTLPVGYRPGILMLYIAATNLASFACRLDLNTSGALTHSGGNNGWLSLNNICFLAEN